MLLTTGDANSLSVAEHTVAAILAVFKRVATWTGPCGRNWSAKNDNGSMDLFRKTLGLIGLGQIGSAVARMTRLGFNLKVIGYDPMWIRPGQQPKVSS